MPVLYPGSRECSSLPGGSSGLESDKGGHPACDCRFTTRFIEACTRRIGNRG